MFNANDFPELSLFIKDTVDCFEKWNILMHYSRQPRAQENVFSLTQMTGRSEVSVKKAVDDLLMQGILYSKQDGGDELYLSTEKAPLFDKLKQGLDDKSARLRLLMVAVETIRTKGTTIKEDK